MYETILVPVDGSPLSERAIPHAIDLARRTGAYLHIVQVHTPEPALSPDGVGLSYALWDQELKQQELEHLQKLAERCNVSGVRIRVELLDGTVIDALKAYTFDLGIDLIVMMTHGRGGLSRAWLGSVADALVRQIRLPVLLLRASDDSPAPLEPIRRILIPLDGSALAERVLHSSIALGRLIRARYTLLRVAVPTSIADHLYAPGQEYVDPLGSGNLQAVADAYLAGVADRMRRQGLEVDTVVISDHSPAAGILEYAARENPGMIAMATHGRSGLARMAIGSVADKVLRGSALPVLLYRPNIVGQSRIAAHSDIIETAILT